MSINLKYQKAVAFVYLILAMAFSSLVSADQTLPQKMVFSYVKYGYVETVAVPLIRRTYASLGIELKMIEMPSHREMLAVSDNAVDGSVIASESVFEQYQGIVAVEPAITESVFILLCQPSLPCDARVLHNKLAVIAATQATEKSLRHQFPRLKNSFYNINLLSSIPALISTQRFGYGILVVEKTELQDLQLTNSSFSILFTNKAYHVLSDQHADMVEIVSAELAKQLKELADGLDNAESHKE